MLVLGEGVNEPLPLSLDTLKTKNNTNTIKIKNTYNTCQHILSIDYKLLSFTWENLNCNY